MAAEPTFVINHFDTAGRWSSWMKWAARKYRLEDDHLIVSESEKTKHEIALKDIELEFPLIRWKHCQTCGSKPTPCSGSRTLEPNDEALRLFEAIRSKKKRPYFTLGVELIYEHEIQELGQYSGFELVRTADNEPGSVCFFKPGSVRILNEVESIRSKLADCVPLFVFANCSHLTSLPGLTFVWNRQELSEEALSELSRLIDGSSSISVAKTSASLCSPSQATSGPSPGPRKLACSSCCHVQQEEVQKFEKNEDPRLAATYQSFLSEAQQLIATYLETSTVSELNVTHLIQTYAILRTLEKMQNPSSDLELLEKTAK